MSSNSTGSRQVAAYDKAFRKVKYEIWTGTGEDNGEGGQPPGSKGFQVRVKCKAKGCRMNQRHGHNKGTSFKTETEAIEWAVKLMERHIDGKH